MKLAIDTNKKVLTLPLHSNVRSEIVERVAEGVTSFFA
jgi:hypothetical protein